MKKVFMRIVILCLFCCICFTAISCTTNKPSDSPSGDTPSPVRPGGNPAKPKPDGDNPTDGKDGPLRVLFLGNSLMFFNDMPTLFEELAQSAGKDVYVDSVTRGSATISDFAHSSTDVGAIAYPKLRNEKWDYVIIEPSRRITPFERTTYDAELSSALTMKRMAEEAGGKDTIVLRLGK